jgi:hypothetical protein
MIRLTPAWLLKVLFSALTSDTVSIAPTIQTGMKVIDERHAAGLPPGGKSKTLVILGAILAEGTYQYTEGWIHKHVEPLVEVANQTFVQFKWDR